jgi:hypothetical protein
MAYLYHALVAHSSGDMERSVGCFIGLLRISGHPALQQRLGDVSEVAPNRFKQRPRRAPQLRLRQR